MIGHSTQLALEPFDSELLGLRIGRICVPDGGRATRTTALSEIAGSAEENGFDQLLARVPLADLTAVWALESAGFLLMDVGVTFARDIDPSFRPPPTATRTRLGTSADVRVLLETMLDAPWGGRYEADPAYDAAAVRALHAQWLRNSLTHQADALWVAVSDERAVGYATCRLVEEDGQRVGEIDLVGTVPAARGRGVAGAVVGQALAWFSTRVETVTVRTQATNYAAAALYERSGMTLRRADATYRLGLTQRGGRQ